MATEYQKQLARLEFTGHELARLLRYSKRTACRWAKVGPPFAVAVLMHVARDREHLIKMVVQASYSQERTPVEGS